MKVWQLTVLHAGVTRNYFTEAVNGDEALTLLRKAYEIATDATISVIDASINQLQLDNKSVI